MPPALNSHPPESWSLTQSFSTETMFKTELSFSTQASSAKSASSHGVYAPRFSSPLARIQNPAQEAATTIR